MIKVIMTRLDGSLADDLRLAAVEDLAKLFEAHVIGLYVNVLPLVTPSEYVSIEANLSARLVQQAREQGDATETGLGRRLADLSASTELRRLDVFPSDLADTATHEARSADVFVALRLSNDTTGPESADVVESVLFGTGRHEFLAANSKPMKNAFDRALVAWNGSREACRALGESLAYLRRAKAVTVIVVDPSAFPESSTLAGENVVSFLRHHGLTAEFKPVEGRDRGVSQAILDEVRTLGADLLVMGAYGHSRLREWLLGGTTYDLMRRSTVPIVTAH
jgi:nucleotide-binding universal stress UspA family protein